MLGPPEWSYLPWAMSVDDGMDQCYFREWIDLHASPGFESTVEFLREQPEAAAADLSTRRWSRVERHFRRTAGLEVAFFDIVYLE